MKRIAILALLVIFGGCEGTVEFDDPEASFGVSDVAPVDHPGGVGAVSALSGAELYQQNCASCHGAEAEGTAVWPSSIQGYAPIAPIVASGRGTMPGIGLPEEDVAKIQEFIASLGAPAEELDGAQLFGRYCASCHGDDASGAQTWPGSIQGYEPIEEIVLQGRNEMAAIPITPDQTQQIQDWLLTLAPSLASASGPEAYDRLCVTCHGKRGEGTATKGPALRYDDDELSEYWIRRGRSTTTFEGDMPEYPVEMLSDAQVAEMFEWINDAPKPATGDGLYAQYCANCHGANAGGGASGEGLRGTDDSFTEVAREGKGSSNFGDRGSYMSSWSDTQLSDAELQLISAYVSSL